LINDNHKYPFEVGSTKQWNVHTCFHPCKPKQYDDVNIDAYQVDTRPACDEFMDGVEDLWDESTGSDGRDHDHILCLNPYLNEQCEKFHPET